MKRFKQILLTSAILINLIPLAVLGKNQNPPPEKPKQSTSILEAVLSLFKSRERRMMTRGEEVCLISPGNKGEQLIQSDRPIFVWWGQIFESQINLYHGDKLVWTKTVPANSQTIAYDGEPLKSGETYDWELVSNGQNYRQTIVLLEEERRKAIAKESIDLDNRLTTERATAEEKAIAKAEYFLDKKLSSDALQQLYSVKNASPDLTSQIDDFEDRLCK